MKVIHIESGLGNQMLSFAEYLVMKKNNPEDTCYIETIVYEIPECNDVICQWNGYELERIFGINAPNIKEILNEEQWNRILNKIRDSQFWKKNWNYPDIITNAINDEGYELQNIKGNITMLYQKESLLRRYTKNRLGYFIKRVLKNFYAEKYINSMDVKEKVFIKTERDIYAGQFLSLNKVNGGIEYIENEIKDVFRFPNFEDKKNIELSKRLKSQNSVAIHARRGDMLGSNGYCYKYGYFKRAVKFIKRNIENPYFYFFCDSGSIEWCKCNLRIFGLSAQKDHIFFVDWNRGTESYRDMQLMSCCKHNIITNSSFGWWGAYLNRNPDKITCSPNIWLKTTHTF